MSACVRSEEWRAALGLLAGMRAEDVYISI